MTSTTSYVKLILVVSTPQERPAKLRLTSFKLAREFSRAANITNIRLANSSDATHKSANVYVLRR